MENSQEKYYKEQMIRALKRIKQLKKEAESISKKTSEDPIAIIGMGCRFAGGVKGPESYWELLKNGVDAMTEIPPSRWKWEDYYDETPSTPGKMYIKKGSFIEGIESFDASFFDLSPREALYFDPQFRMLLEVSHEALENAGIPIDRIKDTLTSVVVGQTISDYEQRHLRATDVNKIDVYSGTGAIRSSGSGRVSFFYNFNGPNLSIETACSASLVAIHLACQHLRNGEANMAIAGGVNAITDPRNHIALSQMQGLSPDGYCKTFDEAANGFARGDGCGLVVLKRLSEAIKDKDPIWAVIKGSAVNHVGRSNGPTAPSTKSQIQLLQTALKQANVTPESIGFIEAHGTGTPLGDPIEMEAIQEVYGVGRTTAAPLIVGSVKTNIGHTEGAAGVAGLIKAVLAIHHQQIPPNLHFNKPSPHIQWDDSVKVPTSLMNWSTANNAPRLAAVSSFGIGGTNAHIIIEEPPNASVVATSRIWLHDILSISAKSPEALKVYTQAYIDFLKQKNTLHWTDICASAAHHRTHYPYRLAITASTKEEAIEQLITHTQQSTGNLPLDSSVKPKIAFVFSGQGSHWVGMGKQLCKESTIFNDTIDECNALFNQRLGWSIKEELDKTSANSLMDETEVIQPLLFCIGIGLARLWMSLGIYPDVVVGHSLGEVIAAYISGALSLNDAIKIVITRSGLMKKMSGKGAILVTELTIEQSKKYIKGIEGKVAIAINNAPNSTAFSGEIEAINNIQQQLEQQDIFCKLVKMSVASHSPQMEGIKEELVSELQDIKPQKGNLLFYSTVLNNYVEGTNLNNIYWGKNLREPVLFNQSINHLQEEGYQLFIELSPHPVLTSPIKQIASERKEVLAISTLYRNKNEALAFSENLAMLYVKGYNISWANLYNDALYVNLPTYPWQKKYYWLDMDINTHQATDTAEKNIEKPKAVKAPQSINGFFIQQLSEISGYLLNEIKGHQPFSQMGIDSIMFIQLRKNIEEQYNIKISINDFWKHPTPKQFTTFLEEQLGRNTITISASHTGVWMQKPLPQPKAKYKLFCFHHAGGNSQVYYHWAAQLPKSIELINIQLPGRAERINEDCYEDMANLTEALIPIIKDELNVPFTFFGHSLGGLIAFSLTTKLKAKNLPTPFHLYLSACAHWDTFKGELLYTKSDKELEELFPDMSLDNFGGDQEYFQLMWKILKSDLKLAGSFEDTAEPLLSMPITVFSPKEDIVMPPNTLSGWKTATSGAFQIIERKGEHNYIAEDDIFLTKFIGNSILEEIY